MSSNRSDLKQFKDNQFYDVHSYQPVCVSRSMDMDYKDSGERALASGAIGAGIYIGLNGSQGGGSLPLLGNSVPAYAQFGAEVALASVATDAALSFAQQGGYATSEWGKIGVAAAVAGGGTAWMRSSGFGGASVEDGVIGFLSYWAGDRALSSIKGTPGKLM